MKSKLEIEIINIDVDDKWYTINYTAKHDEVLVKEEVNGDYCHDHVEWLEMLEDGEAEAIAFKDFIGKYL